MAHSSSRSPSFYQALVSMLSEGAADAAAEKLAEALWAKLHKKVFPLLPLLAISWTLGVVHAGVLIAAQRTDLTSKTLPLLPDELGCLEQMLWNDPVKWDTMVSAYSQG
jgi:hypothetical protein